jgi:hypothetical protein
VNSSVKRFLRTYILAVTVLGLAAIGVLISARWLSTQGFDYGAPRPTPATLAGYTLSYRRADSPWTQIRVSADGRECDALAATQFLRDACVLAVNVDPSWIAAPAAGRINSEDTPSFVAVTWRAVMARDPGLCDRGGLLQERSARCKAAAAAGSFTFDNEEWAAMVSSEQR